MSSTGRLTDSVVIDINYIRLANKKLVEAKYNKLIINEQDSLINLYINKYNILNKESNRIQQELNNAYETNNKLNKSLNKAKNKNYILGGIAATGFITFVVCILLK